MIRVEKVSKVYPLGAVQVTALSDIDLTIQGGEFLAISGPSGSGKTTLLNIMGCIEKPTRGEVFIGSQDIAELGSDALADLRAGQIGYIFQNFNLLPVLTAEENVEYPLLLGRFSKAQRVERVRNCLREVGLEKWGGHKPRELSGGQRQRVAIARALVADPAFVLADEPTANLDHQTGSEILALMKDINARRGTTFIFSTHDPKVMAAADRVVRLSDGRLENEGAR
jgi:putative ABC transport system ATP-binding protein